MARDTEFYERRIAEEQAAAAKATDPVVRARHDELAKLHEERLAAMSAREQTGSRPRLKMAFDDTTAPK